MKITELGRPYGNSPDEYIALAFAVAGVAHRLQINKDGTAYVNHPVRLQQRWAKEHPKSRWGQVIALLHDVIEDTDTDDTDLIDLGFPPIVLTCVSQLTRHGENTEASYFSHIQQICDLTNGNDKFFTTMTKLYDLEDNMDLTRLSEIGDWEMKRTVKYHKAWLMLRAEASRMGWVTDI